MSDYVHYRGVAKKVEIPQNKTVVEFANDILKERNVTVIASYYSSPLECLCDNFDTEYFYHPKTNTLYSITRDNLDPYDDIINAKIRATGDIEYELRYYNGGAGFSECLEEALDKLD